MSTAWRIRDQQMPYFITTTVVDWVDIFSRKSYRDIFIQSLDYCITHKKLILYGFVVMSNHAHLIVQSEKGDLSGIIRDLKKYTSNRILETMLNEPESRREWILHRFSKPARNKNSHNFQVWNHQNHAVEIFSEKFLWTKLDYIHLNPVRAGIVEKASEYLYSSASNYVTGKGILSSVHVVDMPVVDVTKPGSFFKYNSY